VPRRCTTAVVGGSATLLLASIVVVGVVVGGCVLGGCVSTSMSAAEVRVPVLLGPVPCIGCAADTPARIALPVSHVAGEARAFGAFIPVGQGVGWGDANDVGISADRLLFWTPCLDDIRLSNVRAQAWQLTVPILFYFYDVSVQADAATVLVAGASCPSP
jgi:hypothetical protein